MKKIFLTLALTGMVATFSAQDGVAKKEEVKKETKSCCKDADKKTCKKDDKECTTAGTGAKKSCCKKETVKKETTDKK